MGEPAIRLWLGADIARKEAALQRLKQQLPAEAVALNYHRADAHDPDVSTWLQDLRLAPLQAPVRLLVLTHVELLSGPALEAVAGALAQPHPQSQVVLMSDEPGAASGALKTLATTVLAQSGRVERFDPPADHASDVPATTAFALLDALAAGRVDQAIAAALRHGEQGRRVPEVLGAIGWQLRQLVQARALQGQQHIPEPSRRRFQRLCERLDEQRLAEAVRLTVEADLAVKTGRQMPQLALECLVVELDRLISRQPSSASA